MPKKQFTIAGGLCLLLAAFPAAGQSLQQILRQSLTHDPTVREAEANERAAQSAVSASKAGHYPVVSLTGTQVLAQKHRNSGNERDKGFNPGITANLNLYAWGGIEAEVEQNRYKAEYFGHKINETREHLGSEIGKLYLGALRAKEQIEAAKSNLERHGRIVADLRVIAKHDKGRQSELDQALDRQLRAESYLIEQQHQLESYLSRLGKYTGTMMAAAQLQDPFERDTPENLVARYRNPDLVNLPGYQAQEAERKSVAAEVKVARASRMPRINLIANANRNDQEAYLNFSWDFYNPAAKHQEQRTAHTLTAAETRSDQMLRDVAERSRNAQIDMQQYLRRYELAQRQIASQKRVVKNYELQFKIARRTLIDVLDAYGDLSNIELSAIGSRNNFRDAALEYLVSQAAVGQWAMLSGVASGSEQPESGILTTQNVSTDTAKAAETAKQPEKQLAAPAAEKEKAPTEVAANRGKERVAENAAAIQQPESGVLTTQNVSADTVKAAETAKQPEKQLADVNEVKSSGKTNLKTQTADKSAFRQPENIATEPSATAESDTEQFFADVLKNKQTATAVQPEPEPVKKSFWEKLWSKPQEKPQPTAVVQPEPTPNVASESINTQETDAFFRELSQQYAGAAKPTVEPKSEQPAKQSVAESKPKAESQVHNHTLMQPETVSPSSVLNEISLQPVSTSQEPGIDADAELFILPETPSPESE